MRKVIMYCDRCKKEFEKWNHKKPEVYGVAEFVYDDREPYLDAPQDLCESCYTELENWWNFTPKTDILDKIRDEIEDLQLTGYATVDGKREVASRAVMQIIDKYRKEGETDECNL